ncbi:class II aldolase/adducin family protein [Ideonella sp.]|uniref:class II aldolase/adducin family protein n=1 Tax=Ideonella sp. TaxID=1929293 RepID=UPI003BB50AFF
MNTHTATIPMDCSPQEWQTRVDLAAAYRLVALFHWDDLVFTHLSARVPEEDGAFLINPYGMLFEEITASSLVKVDAAGNKLSPSEWPVNPAGFTIHSAVHAARHEAQCVMHTHTLNGVAVSAQAGGLRALSQQSIFVLGSLGYHDYEGVALRDDEKPRLVRDLGQSSFLMLRNHGLLTVGRGIAEAFQAMYLFEAACAIQVRAQAGGGALIEIDPSIIATARQQAAQVTKGQGANLIWPGLLRRLDRQMPGYAS